MTEGQHDEAVEALLHEDRTFAPTVDFIAQANVGPDVYATASADPEAWWAEQARTLEWETPFTSVLEWEAPFARWFADGTLNASVNCLDRHVAAGRGDKVALHWVGEPQGGECPRVPRRRGWRPGGDLHADDPRGDRGHAGLCTHRCPALGDFRWLLG